MTAPLPQPTQVAPRLLPWFDRVKRDLPWRRTHDPYRIWVSEIMLQQTQVSRVVDYYRRFLAAYPTPAALAAAPLDEVLRLWEGLGYYARARNLQKACQVIVAQYGGRFPRLLAQVAALPGVGRYTAGAILSIAYGDRLPALDANARRVFSRVLLEPGDTTESRRRLDAFGEAAVPEDRPGDYNQAVMELGALTCVSRNPRCPDCPLNDICRANLTGRQNEFPVRVRRQPRTAEVALAVVERKGTVLVAQRPVEGVWAGFWTFPFVELGPGDDPAAALAETVRDEFGLRVAVGKELGTVTHTIMHRRVTIRAYACEVEGGRLRARQHVGARWVRPAELGAYALPSPHRRVAALLRGWVPRPARDCPRRSPRWRSLGIRW